MSLGSYFGAAVLGTNPGFILQVNDYLFIYLFILRYRGLNPGAFYLRATPLALFFILYFETGSHEVAEGLPK